MLIERRPNCSADHFIGSAASVKALELQAGLDGFSKRMKVASFKPARRLANLLIRRYLQAPVDVAQNRTRTFDFGHLNHLMDIQERVWRPV